MPRSSDPHAAARQRLLDAIRGAACFSRTEIRGWEREAERAAAKAKSDWLWDALMLSFATWGSSRGSEALSDPAVRKALAYRTVVGLRAAPRERHLRKWFLHAKFRYAESKARFACDNVDRIEALGGIAAVGRMALAAPGREAKLRFVTSFKGVGEKYGRNLWMDRADPDFRRSIAVDLRLTNIASAVGVREESYEVLERFFVEVADALRLSPWGLDRFLYRKYDELLPLLRAGSSTIPATVWVLATKGGPTAAYRDRDHAEQALAARRGGTLVEVPLDPSSPSPDSPSRAKKPRRTRE